MKMCPYYALFSFQQQRTPLINYAGKLGVKSKNWHIGINNQIIRLQIAPRHLTFLQPQKLT